MAFRVAAMVVHMTGQLVMEMRRPVQRDGWLRHDLDSRQRLAEIEISAPCSTKADIVMTIAVLSNFRRRWSDLCDTADN